MKRNTLVVLSLIGLVACTATGSSTAVPVTIPIKSTPATSPYETSVTYPVELLPTSAPLRPSTTPLFVDAPGIIRVPDHFPKESSYILEPRHPTGYSLSPDGQYLTVSYRVKSSEICDPPLDNCLAYILFLVDTATGEAYEPFPKGYTHLSQAAPFWSPSSQMFVFSPDGRQVWLAKTDGSEPYPLADGYGGAWSPDGLKLVITETESGSFGSPPHMTVSILDLTGRKEVLLETDGLPNLLAWSPDGETIAMTWSKISSLYEDLYTVQVSDPKPKLIKRSLSTSGPLSWTSDGNWLMVIWNTLQFIHRDGQCTLTPLGDLGNYVVATQGDKLLLEEKGDLYIVDLEMAFGPDFLKSLKCP